MELKDLITWIKNQQDKLDLTIAQAADNYYKSHYDKPNLTFDINECSKECYALSNNKDLCYDRPSIGFVYSLWYQGRRINTFLKYFAEVIYNARHDKTITLFDLGAGTGAVQWACGIVISGFQHFGIQTPRLKVINIDTSPFMLDYNRSYLWPCLKLTYPQVNQIETEYNLNSWDKTLDFQLNSNIFLLGKSLAGYRIVEEQGLIIKEKLEDVKTEKELHQLKAICGQSTLHARTLE